MAHYVHTRCKYVAWRAPCRFFIGKWTPEIAITSGTLFFQTTKTKGASFEMRLLQCIAIIGSNRREPLL